MNAALFNAVTLTVDCYGSWKKSDVDDNGAVFEYVKPISDLEGLLNKPRSYNVRLSQTLMEAANVTIRNRIR